MKVSNSRKIIATLCLSLAWVSTTNTHAEDIVWKQVGFQNKEQPAQTGFPEKLKTFIELPGKKDFIEIPMQETYYISQFVSNLSSSGDYGDRMRSSFIEVTPAQLGVVKAKMKTTSRSLDMPIKDLDTGYFYEYSFGNGYVISTRLSIPIDSENNDNPMLTPDKIDYIKTRFDKYLISQGYTNTTSMLGKLFNNNLTYEKGNILIELNNYGFIDKTFTLIARNKEIQNNIKEIRKELNKNDVSLEYKNLDVILETK